MRNFFSTSQLWSFSILISILCFTTIILLENIRDKSYYDIPQTISRKVVYLEVFLLVGAFVGVAGSIFSSTGIQDIPKLKQDLVRMRPHVSDSTYHQVVSDLSEVKSYEDLEAVRARIDSMTEE